MANLNKVMLIGRLTRDPEIVTFANGGKVAKLGFAVNNRRKTQDGNWEDVPVWIDCEVYNRGETGKLADIAQQYLARGRQVYIEGHLILDKWTDKNDGKERSKLKVVVDNFQMLEPRPEGAGEGGGQQQGAAPARSGPPARQPQRSGPPARQAAPAYQQSNGDFDEADGMPSGNGNEDDIPF